MEWKGRYAWISTQHFGLTSDISIYFYKSNDVQCYAPEIINFIFERLRYFDCKRETVSPSY